MEPNNGAQSARKQRTPKEITQLLQDYANSEGMSVREYCELIGVS